jgi:signal transduction histidine kinase
MGLLRRLDPRLQLSAAIGWAVFAVVTLAALVSAALAANEAEHRARADVQALLGEFATQVRDALSLQIEARRALLLATAAQIAALNDRSPASLIRVLDAAQEQVPEFGWLGVADAEGRLLATTAHEEQAAGPAVQSTWFRQGKWRPVVDDTRAGPSAQAQGMRLIEMSAPLGSGAVVVATLPWNWVEAQITRMQQALDPRSSLEVLIASRNGVLLIAPPPWLGRQLQPDSDLSESGAYEVVSRAQLRMAEGVGLGWTATVRRRAEITLAPVRAARGAAFFIVFAAGLLAAGVAVLATHALTQRLSALARQAEAVRRGEQGSLKPPPGRDEIARIGAALAEVVGHLQAEKRSLQQLNLELDERVAERTARIERLADETRHAAVTRERLRLARDLHDTLAHSLMALLTQIRVVRKLRPRMGDAELDDELSRAEAVAASGLHESRAAIAQMRDNAVRSAGLGAAVQDLVRRFGERCGLAVDLHIDPLSAGWADERAETLFRIAEEALRNVERHAQARQVVLSLSASGDEHVELRVADDGIGFDAANPPPGHFGLRGMQEQALLIGAELMIDSGPSRGTTRCVRSRQGAPGAGRDQRPAGQ